MDIGITSDLALRLQGFLPSEVLTPMAAKMTVDILFPYRLFPPLRSKVITVSRAPVDKPMYVANCSDEVILLNCSENRPWQFIYQLAHELGHLANRSDLRFRRKGRHCWIEEVLCGAYSVYAMRQLSRIEGPLKGGAQHYVQTYIEPTYDPSEVSHSWFEKKSSRNYNFDDTHSPLADALGMVGPKLRKRGVYLRQSSFDQCSIESGYQRLFGRLESHMLKASEHTRNSVKSNGAMKPSKP